MLSSSVKRLSFIQALRYVGTRPMSSTPQQQPVQDTAAHNLAHRASVSLEDYTLPHPIWTDTNAAVTHLKPRNLIDWAAYIAIKVIRTNFDILTGFHIGKRTDKKWLTRMVFLETVAAVPGNIAGTVRHLASLRDMRRDRGWIHTLMEEAENERMHLLTALTLLKPGRFMKAMVFLSQGIFYNFYWFSYLISPRFCHRMVGYLEEEAVVTYTKMLKDVDDGQCFVNVPAPAVAKKYWQLADNATMREVLLQIRADEAHHRQVNHDFATLPADAPNPYKPGI